MFDIKLLTHKGKDNSRVQDRLLASGYKAAMLAENVAVCDGQAQTVLTLWMQSPAHRLNLLNPNYNDIGIAVVPEPYKGGKTLSSYWTICLAAPVSGSV